MTPGNEPFFEERPNVPVGWVRASFHEVVADALIGLVRAKEDQNSHGDGVPYVKMNNVTIDGKVILDDLVYVQISSEESQRYALCEGDILFNTRNSNELVGKTGLVTDVAVNPVYNNNLMRIRTVSGVSPEFLSYQMCSQGFRASLAKVKRATTNVAAIYAKDLMPLQILLPPTDEQSRIVTKLEELFSELDSAVASLKRVQAQLKCYRQSVLKHAVEGRLTAEWREKNKNRIEPADKLLKRILAERRAKWEERELAKMKANGKAPKDQSWKKKYKEPAPPNAEGLPELPEGWCWATVDQVGRHDEQIVLTGPFGSNLGRGDFMSDGVPLLTIGCLRESGISRDKAMFISEAKARELDRYTLKHGDLLFSRMATVGRAGFVTQDLEGTIFNYHLMRLRLLAEVCSPYFFLYYVRAASTVTNYVREVNHGATRDGINTPQLLRLAVSLPPLAEQRLIVDEVESRLLVLRDMEETVQTSLRRAESLRQAILRAAFSGQLVPQDPADEPASILLERIRPERRKEPAAARKIRVSSKAPRTTRTRRNREQHEGQSELSKKQV